MILGRFRDNTRQINKDFGIPDRKECSEILNTAHAFFEALFAACLAARLVEMPLGLMRPFLFSKVRSFRTRSASEIETPRISAVSSKDGKGVAMVVGRLISLLTLDAFDIYMQVI